QSLARLRIGPKNGFEDCPVQYLEGPPREKRQPGQGGDPPFHAPALAACRALNKFINPDVIKDKAR
ncbi:MAG: hypothetical protein RLZZ369_2032, partial [Pseudomonadota bacterium]